MKLVKSLLLSAPAAVMAFAGANAADLPSKKAAPVSYVKICDAYGAGFFYIPGTDTCLKVGGYARAQYEMTSRKASAALYKAASTTAANATYNATTAGGLNITTSGQQDDLGWMARGRIDMDARTQSAFGTVRTVLGLRTQSTSGEFAAAAPAGASAQAVAVEAAFIQFAGITAGRATENFQFMPAATHFWTGQHEWANFPAGVKQLAYTASFGGGFSATIALEDKADFSPGLSQLALAYNNTTHAAGTALSLTAPNNTPVVIANLRADQAWGSAQLMGAVDQNKASTNSTTNSITFAKTGYAIGGGVKINLPMLAAGDQLWLTAAYADGLIDLIQQGATSQNAGDSYQNLGGLQRVDQDLVVDAAGSKGSTTGYSVGGAFQHYWISSVRSVVGVSYAEITPPSMARNAAFYEGGLSKAKVFEVSGNVIWSPVQNFDIGLELAYRNMHQSVDATTAANLALADVKVSPDSFNARLRLQRQF